MSGSCLRRAECNPTQALGPRSVSNHCGRPLDGAQSAISKLPAVAEAVGDQVEVLFDSSIRSGQDILRAIALGA